MSTNGTMKRIRITVGGIKLEAELKGTIPKGMTKADYAEMKFNDALIEDDDFDMIVMGRTQGYAPAPRIRVS